MSLIAPYAQIIQPFFLGLITSFICLLLARKVAIKVGLVDHPNARKLHQGVIPLVGGISVCLTIVSYILLHETIDPTTLTYLGCAITLTTVGAFDDKLDISYKIRIIIQAVLAGLMMFVAGLKLQHLGNLFAFGNVELGIFGLAVTVFAVIGAINAFNMVDGIDGLLGGLSIVTFSGLAFLFFDAQDMKLFEFCLIFIAALIPYVAMNLGWMGKTRKVFMGDAGSMLIGFSVIWLLLSGTQSESSTYPCAQSLLFG